MTGTIQIDGAELRRYHDVLAEQRRWAEAVLESVEAGDGLPASVTGPQRRALRGCLTKVAEGALVGYGSEIEVKSIEVSPLGERGTIELQVEAGRVGDEGTAAAVFSRAAAQLFIGPRGGVKMYCRDGRRLAGLRHISSSEFMWGMR